jgi:hypothetical protein
MLGKYSGSFRFVTRSSEVETPSWSFVTSDELICNLKEDQLTKFQAFLSMTTWWVGQSL